MTTVTFVSGSTMTDAVSQANAAISATDYVSDVTMDLSVPSGQGAGSSVLIGFVKNNGHFAGFRGHNRVKFKGTEQLTAALLTTNLAATSANTTVVGMDCGIFGSNALGSIVYAGVSLERDYTTG